MRTIANLRPRAGAYGVNALVWLLVPAAGSVSASSGGLSAFVARRDETTAVATPATT